MIHSESVSHELLKRNPNYVILRFLTQILINCEKGDGTYSRNENSVAKRRFSMIMASEERLKPQK